MPFRNPRAPELRIEILAFDELRRKAPADYLARPQRPAFHQVHVVTQGRCAPEVDFARVALKPGTVAWVRPDQTLRFDLHPGVEGWLLLFTADMLAADAGTERVELGAAFADVLWLVERMRGLCEEVEEKARGALLHHLLHAVLLFVQRAAPDQSARVAGPFVLFRAEVERRFALSREVASYERYVGYSAKTLTRTTRAATGMSAKRFIDQRVLLEARRLLAHTELSVGEIAGRIGFSEPTNFIKFFRREGGESPSAFRRRALDT